MIRFCSIINDTKTNMTHCKLHYQIKCISTTIMCIFLFYTAIFPASARGRFSLVIALSVCLSQKWCNPNQPFPLRLSHTELDASLILKCFTFDLSGLPLEIKLNPLKFSIGMILNILEIQPHSNGFIHHSIKINFVFETKNPACGRHQLSRPMLIVGPIQI